MSRYYLQLLLVCDCLTMFGTRDAAHLSVPVPSAPRSSLFGDAGGDESGFPRGKPGGGA